MKKQRQEIALELIPDSIGKILKPCGKVLSFKDKREVVAIDYQNERQVKNYFMILPSSF